MINMRQPVIASQCRQVPQDVAEQEVQPPPAEVLPIFPPNMDIILSVFFDLHEGQNMSILSLLDLNKTSNKFLNFLHLNS